MAKKKKETERFFGQMPLPEGRKRYRVVKRAWNGLNSRITTDSGCLSYMNNISTKEYPYLTPACDFTGGYDSIWSPIQYDDEGNVKGCAKALGIFGFDDFLIVIYRYNNKIMLDYIRGSNTYTGILSEDGNGDDRQRCVVQFNMVNDVLSPRGSGVTKKLIILPDKKAIDFYITQNSLDEKTERIPVMDLEERTVPFKNITSIAQEKGDKPIINLVNRDDSSITVKLDNLDEDYSAKKRVVDWYIAVIDEKYPSYRYKREKLEDNVSCGSDICFTELKSSRAYKICAMISNIEDSPNITVEWYFATTEEGSGKTTENDYEMPDYDYLKNVLKADRRYVYRNEVTNNCYRWVRNIEAEEVGWQFDVPATFPDMDYATVCHGRLFGVGRGRIYASGYNDYANWTYDTEDEYNESNAWCSTAQANTKADGEFTGITTYQGHVLAFKKDLVYEVYNTKNPFRIIDIYGDGTIDNRTIQEVNGSLFFVAEDDVYTYTGAMPKRVGYNLKLDRLKKDDVVVSGTDGRNYYLWVSRWNKEKAEEEGYKNWDDSTLYVYDTYCGQWTIKEYGGGLWYPVGIASNDKGIYFLKTTDEAEYLEAGEDLFEMDVLRDGNLRLLTTGNVNHFWQFETDFMTNNNLDIEHLKKIQIRVKVPTEKLENSQRYPYFMIHAVYKDDNPLDEDGYYIEERGQLLYDSSNGTYGKDAKTGDYVVRVVLRKSASDGVKLVFEGKGYVRFYNMELIYENGGELSVTI